MVATSSQLNNLDTRLFSRQKSMALSLVLAVFLCLMLMFIDTHYHQAGRLRMALSYVTTPLQYAIDYPARILTSIRSVFGSKLDLVRENMALHYQQSILEAKLQRLKVLREENSQLKALLQTSAQDHMQVMAAEILAVEENPSRQLVVVNKGIRDGAYVGQPVLDARGIMGQVIDVGLMASTVLLISDAKCAVPVRNHRTGERAILVGMNDMENLELINLPKSSGIQPGDLLVTSGLGRRYPEGYPVGQVSTVRIVPGDEFIKVTVKPMAKLNRSRLVLMVWPDEETFHLTEQVNERLESVMEGE